MHIVFVSSGAATALYSPLSSCCFKMASDRAKKSNYVHSHISGIQGVNITLFCAGTQALVPEHQVRTAPKALWTPGSRARFPTDGRLTVLAGR